jgi:small subunit ribosomal protein S4
MKIGPKFKIARRLGAPIFEKTQTQKFAMSQAKKGKADKGPRQRSDFGLQMIEKQKARYTYLLTEKQFSNYVRKAIATKGNTQSVLYESLELRLDNVVYRLGFANTRAFARQIVSHGHIMVNDKRVTIPSYKVEEGDKVTIRPGSSKKNLFLTLDERLKNNTVPSWIHFDPTKKEGVIQGLPKLEKANLLFDLNSVLDFYSR